MTSSRTSFGFVIGALAVVLVLGGILFATGYFGERTSAPTPTVIHAGWKTVADENVSFLYPENIGATYTTTTDWPPKVQFIHGPFTCSAAGDITVPAGKTEQLLINGREYCMTTEGEGAAGSTYLLKAYAFAVQDQSGIEKVAIFTFGLREVQCANYDDPQKTECENERATFDISNLVDEIAQTLRFIDNE